MAFLFIYRRSFYSPYIQLSFSLHFESLVITCFCMPPSCKSCYSYQLFISSKHTEAVGKPLTLPLIHPFIPSPQPPFPFTFAQASLPNLPQSSSSSFPLERRRKAYRAQREVSDNAEVVVFVDMFACRLLLLPRRVIEQVVCESLNTTKVEEKERKANRKRDKRKVNERCRVLVKVFKVE